MSPLPAWAEHTVCGSGLSDIIAASLSDIAGLAEYLVEAIDGASKDWGVPDLFIGVIIIPIVGNAAEHATAVVAAWHNKMELSLGVAVGSSVQVRIPVLDSLHYWIAGTC
jgi:calcium/proton exchanger cax